MKRFISLFLVFSILGLSGNLFAKERKGADLLIQKTYGIRVRGELIAVKENSLLLLESDSGSDISFDIGDVKVIKIVKKSKAGREALFGLMIGGFAGGVLSSSFSGEALGALIFGSLGGLIGLLIGGITGFATGKDETIQIEGKSDIEIQEILEKLSKKARIKNAQ